MTESCRKNPSMKGFTEQHAGSFRSMGPFLNLQLIWAREIYHYIGDMELAVGSVLF